VCGGLQRLLPYHIGTRSTTYWSDKTPYYEWYALENGGMKEFRVDNQQETVRTGCILILESVLMSSDMVS
jgi:hypothetical protein